MGLFLGDDLIVLPAWKSRATRARWLDKDVTRAAVTSACSTMPRGALLMLITRRKSLRIYSVLSLTFD